jgi:hypothetical protein
MASGRDLIPETDVLGWLGCRWNMDGAGRDDLDDPGAVGQGLIRAQSTDNHERAGAGMSD